MQIVQEQLVDWEPLRMRFIARSNTPEDRLAALMTRLEYWFQQNATGRRTDCDIRSWTVHPTDYGVVETYCEHLSMVAVERLAKWIERSFPDIGELRLGGPTQGIPTGLSFDRQRFATVDVELDNEIIRLDDFAVSLHYVSIGQFIEFMDETGYQAEADREGSGLVENVRLNWGTSPKLPAVGVSHEDASAFCDWSHLRLPTEAELHHFLVTSASRGHKFEWGGECWTSTPGPSGTYVVRNGPYAGTSNSFAENFRQYYRPNHHDYPFIGFRVAKTLPRASVAG